MNFKEYALKHVDGKSFTITKEMTKGKLFDPSDCKGARLLKSITPKEYHRGIVWASRHGYHNYFGNNIVIIDSNKNLMRAKEGDIIELKVW